MKINKSHVLSNCQHAGIIVNDELIYVHARSQIKQEILTYYTFVVEKTHPGCFFYGT